MAHNEPLRRFYRRAVHERLGFEPASNAIKPVHIANGLARGVAGRYGDAMPLHEAVRLKPVHSRPPKPVVTAAELHSSVSAFEGCDEQTIGEIRLALSELLTVDHAVLGLPNYSSYTLSHSLLATNDPRDQGIGDFLWALLTAPSQSDGHAERVLRSSLGADPATDPIDDLTAIALPLLESRLHDWHRQVAGSARNLSQLEERQAPSRLLGWLRLGFDQLAGRQTRVPQLLRLRQLVLLGAVGVHLYLVQWETEINPELQSPGSFCPILLDFTGDTHSRVAEASRDSFQAAIAYADSLAQWLIAEQLSEEWPEKNLNDGRAVRTVIAEYDETGALEDRYRMLRDEGVDVREALETALFELGSGEFPSPPSEFARYLALRSGFVGPRRGRGRKGYQISLELLTVLTLAIVPEGAIWPVPRFLEELWNRFGIVVGGRDQDLDVLAGVSIDRLTQDDLDANVEQMVALLEEQGLARRYGDGVRQIGSF